MYIYEHPYPNRVSPSTSKKSIYVRKVEMEMNAWKDSPEFDLSETV
jgi:hypothetical protein